MIQLGYIIVYVADVSSTVDFYHNAFGIPLRFMDDSQQYAELDTGSTTLAFATQGMADSNGLAIHMQRPQDVANGTEIVFVTPDVQVAYTHAVASGAEAVTSPEIKPWGQTVGYVRDCNGVLIEICTPMA